MTRQDSTRDRVGNNKKRGYERTEERTKDTTRDRTEDKTQDRIGNRTVQDRTGQDGT